MKSGNPKPKTSTPAQTGRTIDLTPSWLGLLPALLAVITDHEKTSAGELAASVAREELRRMAGLADAHVTWRRNAVGIEREIGAIAAALAASSDPAIRAAAERLAKLAERI